MRPLFFVLTLVCLCGISLETTGFQYPAEYSLPAAKRIRLENGVDMLQQHPDLAYPDTDQQYAYAAPDQESGDAADADAAGAGASSSASSGDWEEFQDDESGATYFYNAKTGESSWGAPPAALAPATADFSAATAASSSGGGSSEDSYAVVNGEYVYNAWAGASGSSK
jgi:hypothetical protein